MEIKMCKFCSGNEFTIHEKFEVFNPDTDEIEIIDIVNKCVNCEAVYYETDNHYIAQLDKDLNNIGKINIPNIGKYMNS